MRRLKKAICILLIGMLAAGCAGQSAVCTAEAKTPANGTLTVNGEQDYKAAQQMLKLVNQRRKKSGLSELKMDKTLTKSAITRAAEISVYYPQETPNRRPNGKLKKTLDKRICYENCANGFATKGYGYTTKEIFNSWMGSSVHRKGILLPKAKSVGVACITIDAGTENEAQFWVLDYSESKAKSVEKSKKTVSFTKKVTALPKYLKKSYFSLTAADDTLNVGESRELFLNYQGLNAMGSVCIDPSSFQWSSGKPSVASVSKKGVVTAKAEGEVKITAKLKTGTKASVSIKLKVKNAE